MYKKQEWNNGTRLDAYRLNYIENGIYECSKETEQLKEELKSASSDPAFQEFQNYVNKLIEVNKLVEELTDKVEKQKKEIAALKTKVTKLQKSLEE